MYIKKSDFFVPSNIQQEFCPLQSFIEGDVIKALFSYQIEILKGSTDSFWTLVRGLTAYPKSPVCKAPKFITLHCSSSQNEGKNSIFCKRLRRIPGTRYLSSYLYYLYLFIYLYKTRHLYFLRVVFQVLPTRSKIWKNINIINILFLYVNIYIGRNRNLSPKKNILYNIYYILNIFIIYIIYYYISKYLMYIYIYIYINDNLVIFQFLKIFHVLTMKGKVEQIS